MVNQNEIVCVAGAIVLPNIQGFFLARSQAYRKTIKEWYPTLKFPPYKPPNFLFAPVWTSLYCGMGYASYLVYKSGGGFRGEAKFPLSLYGIQLALNWAWTPLFFGYKKLGWSTVEMCILFSAATITAISFYKMNHTAGYLFGPYLAWLAFALNLNFQIWRLNKKDRSIKE